MIQLPTTVLNAALAAATESGRDVAAVPLEEIARRAGISRATLYRRIGSRRALNDAVRAAGIDPGGRPAVRERAVAAAAGIVRERGLAALTLDAVAAGADCSVPSLHSQLGGREGLLAALFERYSPLPRVEQILAGPSPTLEAGARALYGAVFDAVVAEPQLLRAVVADALARPDGPAARHLTIAYLPRVLATVGGWLAGEVAAGRCRPLPLPLLLQLFAAPIVLHAASRPLIAAITGSTPPAREEVVETLSAAFCRAVALPTATLDVPVAERGPASPGEQP